MTDYSNNIFVIDETYYGGIYKRMDAIELRTGYIFPRRIK